MFDWNFTTTAQRGLNGRVLPYARGHVLGGSSSTSKYSIVYVSSISIINDFQMACSTLVVPLPISTGSQRLQRIRAGLGRNFSPTFVR